MPQGWDFQKTYVWTLSTMFSVSWPSMSPGSRNSPAKTMKFYLFCCLKNRLIDISRRESRTDCFRSEIVPSGFEISIEESLADEEEYQRLKAKVEELMSELTPSQKEAVYLRYMQEMSYEEIAQLLNITPESARKNVFRAMNKMRLAAKRNPTLAFFLLFIHF